MKRVNFRKFLNFLSIIPILFCVNKAKAELVQVPMIDTSPVIDGDLNDNVWSSALVFTDFKTLRPSYGLPASEDTKVFIAYDYNNIYIGFQCFDKEDGGGE